jgi:AraC family transcriptional regulator, regulatory protein of adaptative response / DNA-3-methyladenine glycosylase II
VMHLWALAVATLFTRGPLSDRSPS